MLLAFLDLNLQKLKGCSRPFLFLALKETKAVSVPTEKYNEVSLNIFAVAFG